MERRDYRRNAYAMIYLTACAVNGRTPKIERVEQIDLEQLFEVCQKHILTACVAYALESVGIKHHEFEQAKEKAIRKNILLDAERAKILKRLEAEKIWYMPLKGSLLKDWYPKLGMRQMSDNDILCAAEYMLKIKEIMIEQGFTVEKFGKGHNDEYFKEPVHNFEMHHMLFSEVNVGGFFDYYENVKERLVRDSDSEYGYHFTDEDFYLYMLSHEYKHFAGGGTGVRSLVDTYIYLRKFSDTLDWDYINAELAKLEIVDYEKQNRELATKVFGGKKLTDDDKKLLDYYIFSGTYGTVENSIENNFDRHGRGSKLRYVLYRLFPTMEQVKTFYPFFYEHKIFMPILWFVVRPLKGIFVSRKKICAELKYLLKGRNKSL